MKKTFLLLAALLAAAPAFAQTKAPAAGGRMTLYMEAMDGQAWQLFFLADAVRRGLPGSELKVVPLVTKLDDGSFAVARGEPELEESRRLALIGKAWPGKLLTYLNGRSFSPSADGWRDAALFAGINPDELERRAAAAEGRDALAEAHARSSAAKITGATLTIDGKKYDGSARLMPLYNAVNAALPAGKRAQPPAGYVAKPKAPPPGFWVVTADGYPKNDQLVGVFDRYFEGIKAQELDFGSAERASRFPDLAFVPSYFVAATPEARSKLSAELQAGLFKEAGGYLVYEDKQRRGYYAARPEMPGKVELFVMSQCPFGVLAENSLLEAEKAGLLPAGASWEIHYIGDAKKNEKGETEFSSLHGKPEWEENARQLFIMNKFPAKFKAYLAERNKDYQSADWQKAAKAAGLAAKDIEAGYEEGKKLLEADFAASTALGMSTSPSLIVNGRQFMVGMGELLKVPGFEKVPPPGQAGAGCAAK